MTGGAGGEFRSLHAQQALKGTMHLDLPSAAAASCRTYDNRCWYSRRRRVQRMLPADGQQRQSAFAGMACTSIVGSLDWSAPGGRSRRRRRAAAGYSG
jgi:hypothetical protein